MLFLFRPVLVHFFGGNATYRDTTGHPKPANARFYRATGFHVRK